ncbi:hypothetical protein [Fibrobacter sp.]|uniref:hypothetical protein n=1 Tax=Fibrobacter sp. TaxID=35828 RepID=UPI00386ACBE1
MENEKKSLIDFVFAATIVGDFLFASAIFVMIWNKVITEVPGYIFALITYVMMCLFQIALFYLKWQYQLAENKCKKES